MAQSKQSSGDGTRTAAKRRTASGVSPNGVGGVVESEPLRVALDTAFRNDEIITAGLTENLRARTKVAEAIAKRADTAFDKFSASRHSPEQRAARTYMAPGDKLQDALHDIAIRGAKNLQKAARDGHKIRLARGDALDKLVKWKKTPDGGATSGVIKLGDLLSYITRELSAGTTSTSSSPSGCLHAAEDDAEQRLLDIESRAGTPTPPGTTPGPAVTPEKDGNDPGEDTSALVEDTVDRLMSTVLPPEGRLGADPPQRADDEEVARSVDTFELRDGPSDVTSFHDFNSLQIAFPHVWTEVFDGELESLGKRLYQEYVRLRDFAGLGEDDFSVSTVKDLQRLIGDVQQLTEITQQAIPGSSRPKGDVGGSSAPAGTNDLVDGISDVLTGDFLGSRELQWLLNPAGALVGFLGSMFANMQEVTWPFLEERTRLPGGIDVISAEFESGAVPAGSVDVVIKNLPETGTWKGIDFYEMDRDGRPVDVKKISTAPNDVTTMRLRNQSVKNGMLCFGKEIEFGQHKAHYFVVRLDERLKDRTRVTFAWEKDR